MEEARTEAGSQERKLFPASRPLFQHVHPGPATCSLLHSPDELLPPAGPSRHTPHTEPLSRTVQLLSLWLF